MSCKLNFDELIKLPSEQIESIYEAIHRDVTTKRIKQYLNFYLAMRSKTKKRLFSSNSTNIIHFYKK